MSRTSGPGKGRIAAAFGLVSVLILAVAGGWTLSSDGGGHTETSETAEESPSATATVGRELPRPGEVSTYVAELNRLTKEDAHKPRFEGRLGPFTVSNNDGDFEESLPCRPTHGGPHSALPFQPSELNLPETYEQAACEDKTVVVAFSTAGRRSYFTSYPVLNVDAPVERVKLVDVGGRPGLVVVPPTPVPSPPFTLFVVQRPASYDGPGILLTVISRVSIEDAVVRALEVLRR